MAKKRYHYDSKGRSRGYSSDESPAARNRAILLYGLPVVAIVGLFVDRSGNDADTRDAQVVSEQSTLEIEKELAPDESLPAAPDPIEYPADVSDSGQATVASVSTITTTEEYMQTNYVGGNPECPVDMHEYHITQCEAGDEGSCSSVRACESAM